MPTSTEQLTYACGTDGCKHEARPTRARWCAACGMPNDPSSAPTGQPPLEDPQGRPWSAARRAGRSQAGPWLQDGRGTGPLAVAVVAVLVAGLWVVSHQASGDRAGTVAGYAEDVPVEPYPTTPELPNSSDTTDTSDTSDTTETTLGTPVDLASEATASASDTAPPRKDAAGNTVRYRASNMLDGEPDTAWRVEGDGQEVRIQLRLPARARITEVGLIPGYSKVDPDDGTERFYQGNRITEARWTFDDGTTVDQRFEDQPTMQTQEVDATSRSILLEILDVRTGDPGFDLTAISDVTISGVLED
jgi:hypothetical protein